MASDETTSAIAQQRFRHLLFEGHARSLAQPRQSVARPVVDAGVQDGPLAADPPGVPQEAHQFIRTVLEQAGLPHHRYRSRPLVRRVSACLRALDVESLPAATAMVQADRSHHRAAADALLIGVTEFFRDRAVFDALAVDVIPMLAHRRGVVDVWSVGCSDGAELYSVAMILAEQKRWCMGRLLGTDCRQSAIDRAVTARYARASARGLPEGLAARYLREAGRSVVVVDELRRMARWRVQDALTINDYACWDLILCRNMAIYLDPGAIRDLWIRLSRALRPGGILVVGRAERPNAGQLRRIGPCIYAKEQEA